MATDLGLDVSTLPRRHLHHTRKRIAKAMRRDGRVRKLQLKRARKRVFNTAVRPSAAYTAAALGVAPIQLAKLRAAAASHQGKKDGMCCTTFFAMVDPDGDPEVSLPCRLLDMFCNVVMRAVQLHITANYALVISEAHGKICGRSCAGW